MDRSSVRPKWADRLYRDGQVIRERQRERGGQGGHQSPPASPPAPPLLFAACHVMNGNEWSLNMTCGRMEEDKQTDRKWRPEWQVFTENYDAVKRTSSYSPSLNLTFSLPSPDPLCCPQREARGVWSEWRALQRSDESNIYTTVCAAFTVGLSAALLSLKPGFKPPHTDVHTSSGVV